MTCVQLPLKKKLKKLKNNRCRCEFELKQYYEDPVLKEWLEPGLLESVSKHNSSLHLAGRETIRLSVNHAFVM